MSLYSVDKLINETRRLAAEFKRSTGTMLPVSGEIARYDVSTHLQLTLNSDPNCGYDALGSHQREGLRVQIKSRIVGDKINSGHRIGQLNPNGNWDIIILSLMDNAFEPQEMYQLEREKVIKALPGSNHKGGKRGAISIAKFKIIAELVWTKEHGASQVDNANQTYNRLKQR